MYHPQLFFGLPLDKSYQEALESADVSKRSLFIQEIESPYLQRMTFNGCTYLGKYLGSQIDFSFLESLQLHIYSLLKELVPDFPYHHHPLLLIAVFK